VQFLFDADWRNAAAVDAATAAVGGGLAAAAGLLVFGFLVTPAG